MASRAGGAVLGHLRRLLERGTVAGLSEGQLLERFLARGDEAAFAAIVARHGPMVLAVCRRALGDSADADDAFQATFLVLVRRARAIRNRESLASWLHGVAQRVAMRARLDAARRRRHERAKGGAMPLAAEPGPDPIADDVGPILHEELARLPEKYRAPLVLCYLEGHTHDQAADALGWPVGTVRGRLARARDRLRGRLARRGVGVTGAALAATLASEAHAEVPELLIEATTRAAALAAAGRLAVAGAVSAGAIRLGEDALRSLFMSKLKAIAAVILLVAGLAVTGGLRAHQTKGGRPRVDEPEARPSTSKDEPPARAEGARAKDDEEEKDDEEGKPAEQLAPLDGVPPKDAPKTPEEQYRRYAKQADAARAAASGETYAVFGGPSPKGDSPYDRRLTAALGLFRAEEEYSRSNMVPAERLLEASRRILEAQQDLAKTPADRLAAARAHQRRVERVVGAVRIRVRTGEGAAYEVAEAEYALADAEVQVAKAEKADERKQAANDGDGGKAKEADAAPFEYRGDKDPKSRAILDLLDRPIAMSFPKETPLKEVLEYIRGKSVTKDHRRPINIYVDPAALAEGREQPLTLDTPVTLDLEDVPLRRGLQLVLLPLGLSYGVVDGILVISTPQRIVDLQLSEGGVAPSPGELRRRQQIREGVIYGGGMGGIGGGMGGQGGGMR